MTGQGWWNFTSSTATEFNYDIHLHPNQSNLNTYPNAAVTIGSTVYNDYYRALKAPTGSAAASFDWSNYGVAGDPCTPGTYYDIIGANYTGFSDFAPGGGIAPPTPLPVELIYLSAEAVDNSFIKLSWATAMELNNLGFEVQRGTDGVNFSPRGWVEGNNNSTGTLLYSFDDLAVAANTIYYYRLKQLDYDGRFTYTHIVSAIINSEVSVSVSEFIPNPAANNTILYIYSPSETAVSIRLYDMLGQIVQQQNREIMAGTTPLDLVLGNLAAGTYSVILKVGDTYFSKRLVISK
jgi:hypothetical protein